MWRVESTTEFEEWLAEASGEVQAELLAKVELLGKLGPGLRRPHADTLNGSRHVNMKELRVSTSGSEVRVAFGKRTHPPARARLSYIDLAASVHLSSKSKNAA